MDVAARIQQLEETIKEAKSMPLSASAILNRDELLEMVVGLRDALPEELKQARWVVKDREELLSKARRDADGIIEKAQVDQARMLSQEVVVQEAQEEAERILSDAREQARQIRLEAEDYTDAKLAQFEIWLQRVQEALAKTSAALAKTSEQVTVGREKLRGPAHPAQALAPDRAPAETEG
jgi:vacuolar-type H+-ATPase subunit H